MDEDWPEFTISELHEIDILVEEERNKELIQQEEREKANKESKKKRFAALQDEELNEMVEESRAKRTKYATKYSISVFNGK